MGTRADFYVGRGASAEWLGSIAWDGYPDGIDESVLRAQTESHYRASVKRFFDGREDVTRPADGWPWPWDDSRTTDYAYAFDGGTVYASGFGCQWVVAAKPWPDKELPQTAVFPDMRDRKRVTYGKRSGLIVVGPQGVIKDLD